MALDVGVPWFRPGSREGHLYEIRQDQFKQMSGVVVECAQQAGQTIVTSMQDLIYTHPELLEYDDVAESLQVWSDDANVYVGIPEESPLSERMVELEGRFPVLHTVMDLQKQTGQATQTFERCLTEKTF